VRTFDFIEDGFNKKDDNIRYFIKIKNDKSWLLRREWYFQGDRPEYYREGSLTPEEVNVLYNDLGVDSYIGDDDVKKYLDHHELLHDG